MPRIICRVVASSSVTRMWGIDRLRGAGMRAGQTVFGYVLRRAGFRTLALRRATRFACRNRFRFGPGTSRKGPAPDLLRVSSQFFQQLRNLFLQERVEAGGLAQIRGATEILEGLRVLLSRRRSENADGTLGGVSGRSESDAVVFVEGRVNGGETFGRIAQESGNHLAQELLIATDAFQEIVQTSGLPERDARSVWRDPRRIA